MGAWKRLAQQVQNELTRAQERLPEVLEEAHARIESLQSNIEAVHDDLAELKYQVDVNSTLWAEDRSYFIGGATARRSVIPHRPMPTGDGIGAACDLGDPGRNVKPGNYTDRGVNFESKPVQKCQYLIVRFQNISATTLPQNDLNVWRVRLGVIQPLRRSHYIATQENP